MSDLKYRRVVLKISGEGLCNSGSSGLDGPALHDISQEILYVAELGAQVVVVVGGGNFIRGTKLAAEAGIHEATAHYMGMLATAINALALQETLESLGAQTRVMSAISMDRVCEPFIRRRCIRHLEKDRVVILASGTGNPFVTTDTCAAQRAVELNAEAVLKATKVDGVYTADPEKDPSARFRPHLTYDQVINDRLAVMDLSAVDLCQQHRIPILVFNLRKQGNMRAAILGEKVGTLIAG